MAYTRAALVALAGLGLRAPAALAAPVAPRAAAVWTMDKAASRLSFRAVMGAKAFDGVFKRWDAQLAFDPSDLPASHLQMVVEAGSAVTGDPARDAALPSPVWLAAGRFPHATFSSRAFAPEGPGRYRISGVVTLHGVSRPLDVHVSTVSAHDLLTLSGTVMLDRRVFGVGPPEGDAAVQVQVRLAARRAR